MSGAAYTIAGFDGMATCGDELGNVCNPEQRSQTEAEWTFTTGTCTTTSPAPPPAPTTPPPPAPTAAQGRKFRCLLFFYTLHFTISF